MWQRQQKRANEWEVSLTGNEVKIGEASDKERIKIVHLKNPMAIHFFDQLGKAIFHQTSFTGLRLASRGSVVSAKVPKTIDTPSGLNRIDGCLFWRAGQLAMLTQGQPVY
ncbi:MAG: hypothetical protein ABIU05_10775 [Nitrospirales bacterium]